MSMEDTVSISNNESSLIQNLGLKLLADPDFTDVTLVGADNHHFPVHKVILSASSTFLRRLLIDSLQQNTFLFLSSAETDCLDALVQFIYLGHCTVRNERVKHLFNLAWSLGVTGLVEGCKEALQLEETNETTAEGEKDDEPKSILSDSPTEPSLKEKYDLNGFVKSHLLSSPESFSIPENVDEIVDANLIKQKPIKEETSEISFDLEDQAKGGRSNHLCPECNKTIGNRNMARHMREAHYKITCYPCTTCEYKFTRKTTLEVHKCPNNPEHYKFKCDLCGDRFPSSNKLDAHKRNQRRYCKQFTCGQCDEKFLKEKLLIDHVLEH